MNGIPYDVMIDGVSVVFSIAGLIWAARFAGWPPDKFSPLVAVLLGILFVAAYQLAPSITIIVLRGIAAGTVAAGGYAGVKKMVTNSPNDQVSGFSVKTATGARASGGESAKGGPADESQRLQP